MSIVFSPYTRIVETVAALLLIAYPSLMFTVKGGMNGAFLFLLILALVVWAVRPVGMAKVVWNGELALYLCAMVALSCAIFISQSVHQHYDGHPYDAASRYFLAVPVLLLLSRLRFAVVTLVAYGFPLATIAGLIVATRLEDGRLLVLFMDLIHFGDFELLLGVLSLLSIDWVGRDKLLLRMLKIAGFVVGIYVSMRTGTRGGWVALPVFALIFMRYRLGSFSLKAISAAVMLMSVLCLPVYLFNPVIHDRVNMVEKDLIAFGAGSMDTDTGIRLQLYKAAGIIFVNHPLFGVGPEGFRRELEPMVKAGLITENAAILGQGEVHNELLAKAAELGLFGLIAMLMVYLVPFRFFYRAMCSEVRPIRQSGMMGLVFVSGFMVFGLTVEVLNLTLAAAFYGLTVAVLLAACMNIHHGEHYSPINFKATHV
ncbi:MAG: O-antigen ligase family protein [Gallionella sp.]|nr:O-antigen ligase family protein [Gallionella sp.]MDD4945448.1 O-antigen ligase family protein [Gallionella sp.]MDD5611786.1 O-antigen ligase family protein [Gallionella sp.]